MSVLFYPLAAIAILSTILVITQLNAMHALLYLIVSLLAVALMFFLLGAPFVGILEIIIYAGAIMVLFLFAIMLLNLGPRSVAQESRWLNPKIWIGPAVLTSVLLIEFIYVTAGLQAQPLAVTPIDPKQVSMALFGTYILGIELASFLLLAGLVGSFHLSRQMRERKAEE